MTLAVSWVRQHNVEKELVVATDSRLTTGAIRRDIGPKLFTFDRGDCVLCIAGSTDYAYPLAQHIISFVAASPKVSSRALDICDLPSRIVKILNAMRKLYIRDMSDYTEEAELKDVQFLLSGFSAQQSDFRIWSFGYSIAHKEFVLHDPPNGNRSYGVAGDGKTVFYKKISERFPNSDIGSTKLNMEPFEILRDICLDRSDETRTVGGAPQLVKVYKHANTMPYCVYWPSRGSDSPSLTYLGRPLLPFEKLRFRRINPFTLEVTDGYIYSEH